MERTETTPVLPHSCEAVREPAAGSAEGEKPPPAAGRHGRRHASSTDGVLASIDARLKAQLEVLQGVSSRVEAQLEDQRTNFAQMMAAINSLQSRGIVHEIVNSPQAHSGVQVQSWKAVKLGNRLLPEDNANGRDLLSVISPGAAASFDAEQSENVRGSSKESTRSAVRLLTAPVKSPTPSRSASRNNTAPTPRHVHDLTEYVSSRSGPQQISPRRSMTDNRISIVPDTANGPPEPRAAASSAEDSSRSVRLPMPAAFGRNTVGEDVPDAEEKAPADTPVVTRRASMTSNRSLVSNRSMTSNRSRGSRASANSNPSVLLGDDARQQRPAGFQGAASSCSDMSTAIEGFYHGFYHRGSGIEEEQMRAATLQAGGYYGPAASQNEVHVPTFTVPILRVRRKDAKDETAKSTSEEKSSSPVEIPTMLTPGSKVHIVVAVLMAVAIVYTGVLSPIVLAYFHSDRISPRLTIPMYIADSLWLVFIAYGFRSAIYDQRGGLVVDWCQIAKAYARRWLFLDLLSAWPAFLAPAGTAAYSACLVLKLLRTPRLAPLISLLQKEHRLHALAPVKWGLIILLVSHSLACFWRVLQCDVESHIAPSFPDLDSYCEGNDWRHMYVSDMYWIAMTLSTVGYGDIYPYNTPARAYNIFVFLLSPVFFGSVVAALSNMMDKLFDEKVESQVAKMSRFMQRHNVSQQVQHRVERSLRQILNNETNNEPLDEQLFKQLSVSLQKTFSFAILSSTIGRFPLFRGAIHSFVAELAQAFTLAHCSAGDLVGEAGQLVEDLVFVVNGELVAHLNAEWPGRLDVPTDEFAKARGDDLQPRRPSIGPEPRLGRMQTRRSSLLAHSAAPGQKQPDQMAMRKGVWFGESCVVNRRHVRTATILAQGHAELAVLNKKTYADIMGRYPAMGKRHDYLLEQMSIGTISLEVLAWSDDARKTFQQSDTWAQRVDLEWLRPQ